MKPQNANELAFCGFSNTVENMMLPTKQKAVGNLGASVFFALKSNFGIVNCLF